MLYKDFHIKGVYNTNIELFYDFSGIRSICSRPFQRNALL